MHICYEMNKKANNIFQLVAFILSRELKIEKNSVKNICYLLRNLYKAVMLQITNNL